MIGIKSREKTIKDLLHDKKYDLDFYQREYVWKDKEVSELIKDLTDAFQKNYDETHDRTEVDKYGHYFLGSIVIREDGTKRYIIDGQQRLTTLTLLLIFLYHSLKDENQKVPVSSLIFSIQYGEKSFNLDIVERKSVMEALFSEKSLDSFEADKSESIRNIVKCYKQIQKNKAFSDDMLPYFVDWLLNKVDLVEITAITEDHAYTVFETMNDRGLSLTPTDMLRGYLLSKITDTEKRNGARKVWDDKIQKLKELGKDEESEAIKAWLRSQFADTVRDYEGIGAKFHRWVRDEENKEKFGLLKSDSCVSFIEQDFEFYSSWYLRLRDAANSLKSGLECVFYNAQNNFTLQYTLLLSPLKVEDTEEEALRKIQIVSTYLDIFINRRIWNGDSIARNNMDSYIWREHQVTNEYKLSSIIPLIRGRNCKELSDELYKRIRAEIKPFGSVILQLHGQNRRKIHLILARMTDYIENNSSKQPLHYHEYIRRKGNNSYEIEHIWANNYEMHRDEFSHQYEFEAYRDRIGGLLLLPKKNNASYGDLPYKEKREHYISENLLAQSLHEKSYKNKSGFSGFKQFIDQSQLSFRAYPEFKKNDLDERQKLYELIAERIWNPERLLLPYGDEPAPITVGSENNDEATPNSFEKEKTWTVEQISKLVPPERREFYRKEHSDQKMHECYSKLAELQNLIQERNWSLNLEFRNYYCAFYSGSRCVFGINLYSSSRLAVWITKDEAEKESLRNRCEFANYSTPLGHAVYPRNITVDSLLPILEFAYKKHQGY